MTVVRTNQARHTIRGMLVMGILLAASVGAKAQEAVTRPAAEARLPGLEAVSGLLRMPSAYVQRSGEVTGFVASNHHATGGMLLGFGQRMESGVGVGDPDSGSGNATGNAKFNLLPEALITPALSVGILDSFDTSDAGRSGYVSVSKSLIPYFIEALTGRRHLALKLHGGYGTGLYRERPFVGAEVWGDNGVGVLGEIVAGHVSIGGRYYRGGIGVTVGWSEWKRVGGAICYTLPLRP